ncbi:MAG: hypothetical protein R3C28_14965 [Pirellulaceae bacterium]
MSLFAKLEYNWDCENITSNQRFNSILPAHKRSVFVRSCLTSGLVTQEQLDEAARRSTQ